MYKVSSFYFSAVTVQAGLCQTWLEPQIVGFLMQRLKFSIPTSYLFQPPKRHSLGSSISSLSEFDFQSPESPGLPSEKLDVPPDFVKLTKQLEHTLDLRSLIRGKRHIKAEVVKKKKRFLRNQKSDHN